jgi:cysteinyl-tRNA synthetase
MESAKAGLDRIKNCVSNLSDIEKTGADGGMTEKEKGLLAEASGQQEKFNEVMDDDLNTADAVSVIFDLVKHANTTVKDGATKEYAKALKDEIVMLGGILGLILETREEVLDADIEKLIEERQQARKDKDFKRADEIRDELLEKGIQLKDTREGVKWSRI